MYYFVFSFSPGTPIVSPPPSDACSSAAQLLVGAQKDQAPAPKRNRILSRALISSAANHRRWLKQLRCRQSWSTNYIFYLIFCSVNTYYLDVYLIILLGLVFYFHSRTGSFCKHFLFFFCPTFFAIIFSTHKFHIDNCQVAHSKRSCNTLCQSLFKTVTD